jgi:GH15 family glucan-1,4-alpha-glucosidase
MRLLTNSNSMFMALMDALYAGQRFGLEASSNTWNLQLKLLEYLERVWTRPDQGIWEVHSRPRHFTFSKVMAWVAFDRGIKSIDQYGYDGPRDHWSEIRDRIADQILKRAYDGQRNTFVQYYGSRQVDASLLLIPQLGFLPPNDSRVLGTIAAIEQDLVSDGLVYRYRTRKSTDGLPPGEGVFLACSFWLANSLHLIGRRGRRHEIVRPPAFLQKRSRPVGRGIRSRIATSSRQFSASVFAYCRYQHRRSSDASGYDGCRSWRGLSQTGWIDPSNSIMVA